VGRATDGNRRPAPGTAPDPAELKTWLVQQVARGEIPKVAVSERFAVVGSLEKTSVGKIDKKFLRRKYGT